MKKRKDSKGELIQVMAKEYLKSPFKEIPENIQKTMQRSIEKMSKVFTGETRREQPNVSYSYSENFFTLARYISYLKSKDNNINGKAVDNFLNRCAKLQNNNLEDTITFTDVVSFFYGYYNFCSQNDLISQCDNIKEFLLASQRLDYLRSNTSYLQGKTKEWLDNNEGEIKKKLLLYCTSTKARDLSFAGKTLNELRCLLN